MGIYKFFSFYRNQEIFRSTIHRNIPSNINIFAIDLNGIIHTNAQKIFGYGKTKKSDSELGIATIANTLVYSQEKYDELEQELFKAIMDDIVGLTRTVAPSETLIIAVDGVAPNAKIVQQRNRRYKAADDPNKSKIFDSNCITSGSDFMLRLDEYINETLEDILNYDSLSQEEKNNPENKLIGIYAKGLPTRIIYSGHLVVGEGEHKISDELRKIPTRNKNVIVHGSDSDLFMIYLTQLKNGWNNIYLFRNHHENYSVDVIIDLKKLEEILKSIYPTAISPADDFVVILFLNGNDFLPAFPTFERIHDALNTLIMGYRLFLTSNPGLSITDGSSIQWNNFGKFLEFIVSNWENTLLTMWAMNEDGKITTGFAPVVTNAISQISTLSHGHTTLIKRFNPDEFKSKWYSFVFSPKIVNGQSNTIMNTPVTDTDKQTMIEKYLEGIAWVYNYYRNGVSNLNVSWFYPYYYAPLLGDIAKTILNSNGITWLRNPIYTSSNFINPLVQLALVLPPSSLSIVPAKLRWLYTEVSYTMDMICEKAYYEKRGKIEDYQGFLILPAINVDRILMLLPALGITEEEFRLYSNSENVEIHRNETGNKNITVVQPRVWRGGRGGVSQRARGRGRGMFRGSSRLAPLTIQAAESSVFVPQISSTSTNYTTSSLPAVNLPSRLGGGNVTLVPLAPLAPLTPIESVQYRDRSQNVDRGRGRRRGSGISSRSKK